MEIRLDGRVALVTGGSRGIGLAIASTFASAGARVMISSRKAEGLATAREQIVAACGDPARVASFVAHAGDPEQAAACVGATLAEFDGIDILVNNAGTNPYIGPMIDVDLPRYDKTQEVNLRGPLIWTQQVWRRAMGPEGLGSGGTVINISSIGGLTFNGPIGVYDTTKAALIHQTKHLAYELAPTVRVNAIAPGLVRTDFARALWQGADDDAQFPWPLRRLGRPDDVANAALFLASDMASWITGEVLVVDGGATLGGGIPG